MALEINQPQAPKKTFVLNRTLHVTKDGKVVEEADVRGVKVLGGVGKAFYEDEAKAMGLDDSHRVPSEPVSESVLEPVPAISESQVMPSELLSPLSDSSDRPVSFRPKLIKTIKR